MVWFNTTHNPRRTFRRRITAGVVVWSVGLAGVLGAAEPDFGAANGEAGGAARVAAWVAALDAPDFATREAATRTLMTLDGDQLPRERWRELLVNAPTLERRHRLVAVGVHRAVAARLGPFLSAKDQGALGIHHAGVVAARNPVAPEPAVRVIRTEPGFPAHPVLWPGDLIVAIDGQALADHRDPQAVAQDMVRMIILKQCGQVVTLTVCRDGRREEVSVTLSSTPVLRQAIESQMAAKAEADILASLADKANGQGGPDRLAGVVAGVGRTLSARLPAVAGERAADGVTVGEPADPADPR